MIDCESFKKFWLKLTRLIDYDVIDRMWEFGVKLSESIDYIVIDHFEIRVNNLILSREQDQTRNSKNTNRLVSMRRIDLYFGLWTHPVGPHPKQRNWDQSILTPRITRNWNRLTSLWKLKMLSDDANETRNKKDIKR